MNSITDKDIENVKAELEKQKRKAEYDSLKKELADITSKSLKEQTEFDSAMTYPDTDKVLQNKGKQKFLNTAFSRLGHMLSPRPATGNFIALGLIIFVLILLRANIITSVGKYDITTYLPYISYLALITGVVQILKSSTRSLIIPLIAIITGGIIATTMNADDLVFTFQQAIYQGLFIAGVVGLIIGALTID